MPRTSSRRWKGCPICKHHKHSGHGDAERMPWRYRRELGRKRRLNRHDPE